MELEFRPSPMAVPANATARTTAAAVSTFSQPERNGLPPDGSRRSASGRNRAIRPARAVSGGWPPTSGGICRSRAAA